MNWLIDGAYGDLYREAMGYPRLAPAKDEWDIERNIGKSPEPPPEDVPRPRLTERLQAWFRSAPATPASLSR
jgi:hypothetical protein